jgi:hypothetical protein
MEMEGKNHMNHEYRQCNSPQWAQQANAIANVAPIQSAQVWIGLSQPQQQRVATTVIKTCQALVPHRPQQAAGEGETHEQIS